MKGNHRSYQVDFAELLFSSLSGLGSAAHNSGSAHAVEWGFG